ncbi:mucin-20 isoform X2 [Heterocephalus glaber]|nr:mucin-20 isoform X2 [Heterocephalus glaber]XP_021110525.1 mucin-20 isoform X2 [Heterocephalus glaber]XP_021110527.1 mucin-20 isoform X2 [Heterocephalus glaber]XP_021110531.1 mucin-20 isoform X2 [Heterocephalus glaber]
MPGISTSLEEAFLTTDLAKTTAPGRLSVETPTLGTETLSKTLTSAAAASKEETKDTRTISLAQTPGKSRPPFPVTKFRDTQTPFPDTETRDPQTTSPVTDTRDTPTIPSASESRYTQTISPASDSSTLTKIIPSDPMAAITFPVETLATGSSSMRTRETTVEAHPGRNPRKVISDTLYTDDSSEEARWITTNILTLVHTTGEAESLSSYSRFSSDNSVAIITTSQALGPDIATPSKALAPSSTTHNKFLRKTETAAVISGTSDTDHSSTGVKVLSTSETSVLSASTEAKSPRPSPTSPAETLSTASASELATPNTTLEASLPNSTTETEVTPGSTPTPGETQVTVSMAPLGETSALSQQSYTTVSGAVTVSAKAASTVDEMTSSAGSPASVSSFSEGPTVTNSTLSETFTTEDTTSRAVSTSRGLFLSVHLTTASSSQETNISAMTMTSPKTPSETFTPDRAFPTSSSLSPVHLTTASSGQETRVTSAMTMTSPKAASETFITEGTTSRAFSTTSSPLSSVLPTTASLSQETTVISPLTMTSPKAPSETFTTEGATSRDFLTSRISLSSVLPTTTSSSQDTRVTSPMTVTSPKTQRKPPTAISSTVWTRLTPEVTAGGDGGFLLMRLRVASTEDLTEPTKAERLVQQLQCELQASLPVAQLSLLHVQRS